MLRKGHALNYSQMILVLVVMIVYAFVFIGGVKDIQVEKERIVPAVEARAVMSIASEIMTSPALTKEKYVFDKEKLDSMNVKDIACGTAGRTDCIHVGLDSAPECTPVEGGQCVYSSGIYRVVITSGTDKWIFGNAGVSGGDISETGIRASSVVSIWDGEKASIGLMEVGISE